MENKELTFAKSLEKARELAKEQNHLITTLQVKEIFSSQELSEEQYGLIYDYLKKNKIGIDEAVSVDDYLTEDEKDFLKEYLKMLSGQFLHSEAENAEGYFLKKIAQIAKYYTGQGVLLEDLIGEGNVALAAWESEFGLEDLPKEREISLLQKIKDAMEAIIAETAFNHKTDAQLVEKVNEIADEARILKEAYGRKVTVSELAEEGKYSVSEIIEAINMAGDDILDIEK